MGSDRQQRVERGLKPNPESRSSEVTDNLVRDRMDLYGVAGMSVAVVDEGKIDWSASYGLASADETKPVTDKTLFQCCSTSKMVASLVALRLVANGKLGLDADVNDALKGWKLRGEDGKSKPTTLRHVLSHTGGINVHGAPGYPRGAPYPTLDEVLNGQPPAITAPVRVTSESGRTYRYSGGGYCVLQKAIETVTEKPFHIAARELVLDPLGMFDSTFEQPLPKPLWSKAASGHATLNRTPVPERWFVYPEQAVGGLWTTATDLAQVILEVQQALSGAGRVLTQPLVEQMLTPHADNWNVGLGTYLYHHDDPPSTYFSHSGAHLGWKAILLGYANLGKGAVVLTNNGYTGAELYGEFLLSVAEEYAWPKFSNSIRG